ncbi:MAG TPA: type II secretion system F family protein [Nitrospiraceae bacterium]|jgi:type IV pilus assembly protein PilC|nr:type II secretion system F family protein [Nitrospiraceae bacterium]
MAVFAYRAARADGSTFEGQIEGDDEQLVRAKLEAEGLLVFRLARRGTRLGVPGLPVGRWSKLPLQEFLVFNQELLALIKAGLPVLRIWDLLIDRAQRAPFREALQSIRQDIRGGASVSESLTKHPVYFSELYLATIRAGEQSGNLAEVLQRYIAYLKLMIELRQKVVKALAYPGFLVVVGIAVVGFLLSYVMPTFVSVYGESAANLPGATRALITVIQMAEAQLIPTLLVAGAVIVAGRTWYQTPAGRFTVDRQLLRLPLIGTILVQHHTIQLARTLATVLAGGTPLVDALEVARGAVSNRFVSRGLASAVAEIREGNTLAAAIERPKILPKLAIEMLSVGEETGSLEPMLRDVAEFYEGDLDVRLSQLTTWIEPVLLLIMGVVVGGIVIIMYLPIFQMAGTIQ